MDTELKAIVTKEFIFSESTTKELCKTVTKYVLSRFKDCKTLEDYQEVIKWIEMEHAQGLS